MLILNMMLLRGQAGIYFILNYTLLRHYKKKFSLAPQQHHRMPKMIKKRLSAFKKKSSCESFSGLVVAQCLGKVLERSKVRFPDRSSYLKIFSYAENIKD